MGASAGTHIATSNIKHVESFDANNIKVIDYKGLNLYNGIIICHYDKDRKQIYQELKQKGPYNVEKLSDSQILYCENDEWFKI